MSNMDNFEAMNKAMKNLDSNVNVNSENDDFSSYSEESFTPPSNLQFNMTEDSEVSSQYVSPSLTQEQEAYMNNPTPNIDRNDELICEGGPLKSELESWKKQFEDVWIVNDLPDNKIYIYRDIDRYEYKSVMAVPNTDQLQREEMICKQCVLFPYEYSYGDLSTSKAGVPSILAQHILETSGFTKASIPRRL